MSEESVARRKGRLEKTTQSPSPFTMDLARCGYTRVRVSARSKTMTRCLSSITRVP